MPVALIYNKNIEATKNTISSSLIDDNAILIVLIAFVYLKSLNALNNLKSLNILIDLKSKPVLR